MSLTSVFENLVDSCSLEARSSLQRVENYDVNAQSEIKNDNFDFHHNSQAGDLNAERLQYKKNCFVYVFGYEQRPVIFPDQDIFREDSSAIRKPQVINECPSELSLGPSLRSVSLALTNTLAQWNGARESSSLSNERESAVGTGLASSSSCSYGVLSDTRDKQGYHSQQNILDYSSSTLSDGITDESVRRCIQPPSVAVPTQSLICNEMLDRAPVSSVGVCNAGSITENQDWMIEGHKPVMQISPRRHLRSDLPMFSTQAEISELFKRCKRPKKLLQSSMKRLNVEELMNDIPMLKTRVAGIYFQGKRLENVGKKSDRRGNSTQPSRFCHICLRRAERVPLMACGRLRSGLCRKVVCEKCFIEFGYDWDVAASPNSNWLCPHCRKTYVVIV